MSEVFILPEMLAAGVEALQECRIADRGDEETAVTVYLAMEAIREIAIMREEAGRVH